MRPLTSFCCSYTCPIWNQMFACARELGGLDAVKAYEAVLVLALLLVYDAEAEENLGLLVKV